MSAADSCRRRGAPHSTDNMLIHTFRQPLHANATAHAPNAATETVSRQSRGMQSGRLADTGCQDWASTATSYVTDQHRPEVACRYRRQQGWAFTGLTVVD